MKNRFFASLALFLSIFVFFSFRVFAGAYEEMEEALVRGDAGTVIALVERGMDVNTVDRQGNTLLTQSIQRNLPELFDYLMLHKARINTYNRNGETALSVAAYLGRAGFARRLVDAGAEMNFFGWPPLVYAAFNGHTEIAGYLIERGAEIDAKTENGSTALFFAARHGHAETVDLLLKRRASPNIVNENEETALDWALKGQHTEIIAILRSFGGRSGKPSR